MNSSNPTAEELSLIASAFSSDRDWASQPRAVYSGEVMERELDELFPVEIGLQALRERREQQGNNTANVVQG
jgi:hypothetical protein